MIEWTRTGPRTNCGKVLDGVSVAVGETTKGAFWLSLYVNYGQRLVADSTEIAQSTAVEFAKARLRAALNELEKA